MNHEPVSSTPTEGLTLWPDLEAAWATTEDSRTGSLAQGAATWTLLKGESRTRVVGVEAPGFRPMVLKIYATPARLAWRTLGMVSRANREFTSMMEAHRRGLPVVRPHYRLESRVMGCLRYGALALETVAGNNLEDVLRAGGGARDDDLALARLTGDLLGRFHRGGLNWATASPRNLLLSRDGAVPLQAIDLPYATLAKGDITGSDDALLDLSCILRMSNGDLAFEGDGREALLVAYCGGDRDAARRLDEQVKLRSHLTWKRQRLRRRVRNLLSPGAESLGSAGCYEARTGAYRRLDSPAVYLPFRPD